MSASNFYIKNAKGYYTIGDDNDGWEMKIEDIKENGRWDGWDTENEWRGLRVWGELLILSRRHDFSVVSGWVNSLKIEIVMRPGYYSGGVLDWDLFADSYTGRLTDYDDEDGFVDAMMDGVREDLINDGWNEGLWSIHKSRIRATIEKGMADAIERAEDFCKSNTDASLRCLGVASNGEAFYEAV